MSSVAPETWLSRNGVFASRCLEPGIGMGQNPRMPSPRTILTGRQPLGALLGLVLALALALAPGLHLALDTGPGDQDCEVCAQLARDAAPPPAPVGTAIVLIGAETLGLPSGPVPRSHGVAPRSARGPPARIV